MAVKKPPIDLWALFSRFGREQKLSLRNPQSRKAFVAMIEDSLSDAVTHDTLLHGTRVENMFAALVVSLGRYKLLNKEDNGSSYPSRVFQTPDYRVVLIDGIQWLVEVKNVYVEEATRQIFSIPESSFERLQRYAETVRCPLKFAIYWARWRIWTIVDQSELQASGGKRTIDMIAAAKVNEFGQLGDRTIGTTPPLVLRLFTDTSKPRHVSDDGEAHFTVGRAAIYSNETEITEPLEKKIAFLLLEFGEWTCPGPETRISNGQLDFLDLTWAPEERANPKENFEMVGTLSRMFARYYGEQTLDEGGIVQTEADLVPDWFSPLVDSNYKSKGLPLWRFILQPGQASTSSHKMQSDSS